MKQDLFEQLSRCQEGIDLLAADYSDLGKRVIGNVRANLVHLKRARKASALFGKWEGVPAIICGAGPSLKKNGAQLRNLKERALLFAGGSALNAAQQLGVQPHFSAGVDPEPPRALCVDQPLFEVPFFYQNRVSSDLLDLVHGPLLWVADNGGYPIDEWLAEKLGIEERQLEGGWNVATFCMALACEMGCDPIILVGMDLSTTKEVLELPGLAPERLIPVGDQLFARRDWIMAKVWIEAFAAFWKEKRFFNATEGGIGFEGIPSLPLAKVAEEQLRGVRDLGGQLHAALQQIPPMNIGQEQIDISLAALQESCRQCIAHCDRLMGMFKEAHPEAPFKMAKFVLHEVELEEEAAFKKVLEPLWNVWKPVFEKESADASGFYLSKLLFFKQVMEEIHE